VQDEPMFAGSNIHYEMATKTQAINCGGIEAIHLLAQKSGLQPMVNRPLCHVGAIAPLERNIERFTLFEPSDALDNRATEELCSRRLESRLFLGLKVTFRLSWHRLAA
jgi:hypothetical protein